MGDNQNSTTLPTPQFDDPGRRERLLKACTALEPIYRRYAEREHAPGVAYGVVAGGELIFTHGFGAGNIQTQTPVDADTVYRIASMTKSFAALALVKLRDEGRLSFDCPVADYVPELASLTYPTADAPPITVRHLLTMSSGWPQDDAWADRQLYRNDASISELYRAGIPFSNPPGITFEYSNTGYMVLGRVISQAAGMHATDYIVQEILQPLGMTSTVWNATDVAAERLALGYRWQGDDAFEQASVKEAWLEEPLLPSGSDGVVFGGIYSTVRDLARWVALFLSAWPSRNEAGPREFPDVVGRSSLREMQQPWRISGFSVQTRSIGERPAVYEHGYGYGLSTIDNGRWQSAGHGGGLPGFGSHMRWAPNYDIGVVALANVTYANMHQASMEALNELIEGGQMRPRTTTAAQAVQDARTGILRLLAGWDDTLAAELFADNFFLDLEQIRWQRKFEELRSLHGTLRPDGPLTVENWLRGRWRMQGERGWCSIWLSLTPTQPPRIQEMEIESILPPSSAMQEAAEALAALTARPTRRALSRLFTSTADRSALWDRVRLVNILCGSCTVEEIVAGDGADHATFRLAGPKGCVNAVLTLAEKSKKLLDARFHWPKAERPQ